MSRVMKDSGVEWIGKYPESSRLIRFRYLFSIIGGNGFSDALQGRTSGDYPFYKASDINGDAIYIEYANNYVDEYTVIHNRFNIVPKNSIIISKIGESLKKNHRKISLVNCCIDNNLEAFTQRQKSDVKFTYYLLSLVDMLWFDNGGTVPSLNNSKLKDLYLPDVPLTRQVQIRAYLDTKCKKIDRLISIQEEMIAELQAYKQSVITEAVTKGLDPDVPMKDSGVEWIGYIPEDAKVVSVARLYNSILGKMVCDTPANDSDTLESYLCAINVHFDGIDLSTLKEMWFSENEKQRYLLRNGDLLVVEGGAGAGGAAIVDIADNQDLYIQNSIHLVRAYKGLAANKYLYYNLYSLVKRSYIDYVCNKATIPHFTKEKLKETPIVYFPMETQQEIINYLDTKCQNIDTMISLKKQKIESLKEYKKSLIYECVTGKREVV